MVKFCPGDIIRVYRGFYFHYGVYVGDGRVVHFCATGNNELDAESADIVETPLSQFSKGDLVTVDAFEKAEYDRAEIVKRALSAVGTKRGSYNLLSNNCEHFVNWCRCGKLVSHQKNFIDNVVDDIFSKGSVVRDLKNIIFEVFQDDEKEIQSLYNKIQ